MSEFINTVDLVGDEALCDSIIDRSITEIADNHITNIGNYAFRSCNNLTTADFPLVTSIGGRAFGDCSNLATADFQSLTSIAVDAFRYCSKLAALILRNTEKVCTLGVDALSNTKIASGTGYIYVPAALIDSYKAASYWSTFAAQFRALEDYTVDGTTTGALDEAKIAA